jgi:chemotaxis protein MotB
VDLAMLRKLAQDLAKQLQTDNNEDDPVKLEISPEGLRISIFDRGRKPVFTEDSDKFTDYGNWIFSTLAWDIARYTDFNIELEGHTEKKDDAVAGKEEVDKWSLSADRANAGRQALTKHGVKAGQIRKVAGFADTEPLSGITPEDDRNRRVTVMLKIRGV